MTTTEHFFSSQAEATRAARQAIWGDVTFARREYVHPTTRPDVAVWEDGMGVKLPAIVVAANVNGRLVAIHFDSYGRLDREGVKVLGKVTR